MNGFFVSITNNLLEDKHFERMGNAVWLYMWLIDKMTEISEGQGITNHGNPVTFEMVQKNFGTMSERTYYRMIDTLRKAGYINTTKARYGLYITINKAKKQFNKQPLRPAKSGKTQKPSPAKSGNEDLPNMADRPAKSGKTVIYKELTNTFTNTSITMGDEAAELELISKLYYQTIKSLGIPNRNNNNTRKRIKELYADTGFEMSVSYLEFMRDSFANAIVDRKPHVNEAQDIYYKRVQIENILKMNNMDSKRGRTLHL